MATLFAIYRHSKRELVAGAIAEMTAALLEIETHLGKPAHDLDILEIGSGQKSLQLAVLCGGNRAIGIDQESSGESLSVSGILRSIKTDGAVRAMKTLARKALGIDKSISNEFARLMGISRFPDLNIIKMDAEQMSFPSGSFDIVYSRAVFEHLANPEKVLLEVDRVLRPGGVFYCLLHLYTSDSGCHDMRIFLEKRGDLPYWAHLRKEHMGKVIENTFLNKLRLTDWRKIFASMLPSSDVYAMNDDSCNERRKELISIRSGGELEGYTDEELLSVTVKVVWKK
jgi:SAM-dependent methyltransferase